MRGMKHQPMDLLAIETMKKILKVPTSQKKFDLGLNEMNRRGSVTEL
jgi:hypothetical protein